MANENDVFKFDKAEPPPIFYNDSERCEPRQVKIHDFNKFDAAEQLLVCVEDRKGISGLWKN